MKFSTKLGIWFFLSILVIEAISMSVLHRHVVNSLIEEELEALLARGNSHRDVLETSFDSSTLNHIELMELITDTEVIIMSQEQEVLASSLSEAEIPDDIRENRGKTEQILQDNWKDNRYVSTVSPFQTEGTTGIVYMLKSTNQFQQLVQQLNHHFGIAAVIILFFLFLTNFFLIRLLTKPLERMKDATGRLSKGDFSVELPVKKQDEIGELAQSIQALSNHLHHLQIERNEFLASISHELRTPLTYIKGFAELGKKSHLSEAERMRYLHIIHEESLKVSDMLKDLFELAKMDQNTFSIQKEKTRMSAFVQAIYEKTVPVFQYEEQHLEFHHHDDFVADIDPARFEQIIVNLLDNARKFSDKGATTSIFLTKANIIIQDEGIGITEEDLPFVFDRMFRAERSRSRLTGGTGLGLSIVKELVEEHNGEITIQSEVNKGTTVIIALEVKHDEENTVNR
ncbi:Alkaline phosphatase synthesis sensor protein PhoR [Bacillus sp. THAF10]|uniref:sensor histidine kinase n=1 Tax=Bacillus sp. THAF10 TaxID=2587848 RepID=UPI001268B4E3|nr:HAMP domain-containing sensor histidine kinase [Bacillus sp. THAF10]QFT87992.1 Alkaline phosphatase synthesis sensor protein PhoR [Bacillus sp. THAF10]